MTRLKCLPIHFNEGIKLNELTIKMENNVLYIFRITRIQQTCSTECTEWAQQKEGATTCMILLKWKLSLISMHLNCLLNFTKASWMMIRKSLPKYVWKCRRQDLELCHCYTISLSFATRYNSKGSVYKKHQCIPGFNLSLHYRKFLFLIVTRTAPFASYLDSEWKCKIDIDTTDI